MVAKRISRRTTKKPTAEGHSARAAILAAAERAFARHGLAGARTDAIAADAGVNNALLYYYFKSKEHLYHAVLEGYFADFNTQALKILEGPGAAQEVLLRYVGLHFDFMSAHHRHAPLFQQCMNAGGAMTAQLVKKYFTPRSEAFGRLLERGMRDGEFRKADPFHTAISIVGLIVFYFTAAPVFAALGHTEAYAGANLRRRKTELLEFVRRGLFIQS